MLECDIAKQTLHVLRKMHAFCSKQSLVEYLTRRERVGVRLAFADEDRAVVVRLGGPCIVIIMSEGRARRKGVSIYLNELLVH